MNNKKANQKDLNHQFDPTGNDDLENNKNFSDASDEKIWSDFKNGNESAFIFIYETYFDKLLTYGMNFIADREVVKDCMQDMFIEIRDKRSLIGNTNAIKPFLFKILRRKIIRFLRKNIHNEKFKLVHEKFVIQVSHEQYLIEQQFNQEQIDKLRNAIMRLSTKEREAIFHFYFEGHAYQHIAEIMGYRLVFGGDWPPVELASSYEKWVETLLSLVSEASVDEKEKLFSKNAEAFYRL